MIEEVTPEETTDPILDMTIMQNRVDQLQEELDEMTYFCSALQDAERIQLMNHLLPVHIAQGMGEKSAIKKARSMADNCISVLTEDMNAKAKAYRELIEAQRAEEDEKRALLEATEDEETTEN